MPNMKKLGEFIRLRMEALRMTDRDVANLSNGHVTYGTVNGVVNCKNKDVRLASLYGIALGIDVSVEILIAIALDIPPLERNLLTGQEQDLTTYFRRLSCERQAFILETVKKLSAQESPSASPLPANLPSPAVAKSALTSPRKGGKK
jgi:hypothetical protein